MWVSQILLFFILDLLDGLFYSTSKEQNEKFGFSAFLTYFLLVYTYFWSKIDNRNPKYSSFPLTLTSLQGGYSTNEVCASGIGLK